MSGMLSTSASILRHTSVLLLLACSFVFALAMNVLIYHVIFPDDVHGAVGYEYYILVASHAVGMGAASLFAALSAFVVSDGTRLRGMKARLAGRSDPDGIMATKPDMALVGLASISSIFLLLLTDCTIGAWPYSLCLGAFWVPVMGGTALYIAWLVNRSHAKGQAGRPAAGAGRRKITLFIGATLVSGAVVWWTLILAVTNATGA